MTVTESTLALHIQEGRATDPAIATLLIQQYAPGVQRLTLSLLNGHPNAPETARTITQQTFAQALNDPDSFMGKENIRAWLYAHVLRQTRTLPPTQQAHATPVFAGDPLSSLSTLSRQAYLPILLRYGHHLPLDEIAYLLRTSEAKIHKQLTEARQKLSQQVGEWASQRFEDSANQPTNQPASQTTSTPPPPSTPPHLSPPTHLPPSHYPRETQRLLDHRLDPEAEANFRDHLETCETCRTHLKQFAELEFHLHSRLSHDPPLPQEQIQDIVQAVVTKNILPLPQTWQAPAWLTHLPFREMGWVLAAAAIFFLFARLLNPFFSSPPPPTTPTPAPTPTLPLALDLSTVFRQTNPSLSATNPFPGQHIAWTLSSVRTSDHTPPTTPLTFSPLGTSTAFGEGAQVIHWDLTLSPATQRVYEGHTSVVTALEFFPQENMLATGDEAGAILIWDLLAERLRFRLNDHPGPIQHLAVSHDGKYLAVALNQGVWVWEMQGSTVQLIQKYRWNGVRLVAFSPDGTYLTAADQENTIAIWQFPAGKFLLRYETLENEGEPRLDSLTRLTFSPDSKKLATGSLTGIVEIVSISQPADSLLSTRLYAFPHPAWISEVRWSPDGTALAAISDTGPLGGTDTASRAVYLWDVETGALLTAPLTAQITRGLSRAIFTENGASLLVSNFDGAVFTWTLEDLSHLVAAVPEPQFFTRTESNLFAGEFPKTDLPIPFTALENALPENNAWLISPENAQYEFIRGNYSPNEATVAYTLQSRAGNLVTLIERLLTETTPPNLHGAVGASAVIQPVQIHGTMGEYITGSWVLTHPDNPTGLGETPIYRWQAHGEARLRWIQAGVLMEIRAPLLQFNNANLSMDDLLILAEHLYSQSEAPQLFTYTIDDGDTCIGIAQRYNTTPNRIAEINGLETCDLIVAGQPLLVPLPTARQTVTETDLNCDGSPERVRAIPDPVLADLSANFGVVVETIPPGGSQYWPIWQLTIADVPAVFFGLPQIYTGSECEVFLGVSIFGSTDENSGLDLYRWIGMEEERVLDANGYVSQVFPPSADGTPPFRITTQSLVRDPAAGGCTRTTTTYEWDGSAFVVAEEIKEEGVDCLEG